MISHAWLTLDGLTIDITADQFAEINDPVIVAHGSAWHAAWEPEPPQWSDVGLAYYADSLGAASDFAQLAAAADESIRQEANTH